MEATGPAGRPAACCRCMHASPGDYAPRSIDDGQPPPAAEAAAATTTTTGGGADASMRYWMPGPIGRCPFFLPIPPGLLRLPLTHSPAPASGACTHPILCRCLASSSRYLRWVSAPVGDGAREASRRGPPTGPRLRTLFYASRATRYYGLYPKPAPSCASQRGFSFHKWLQT